MIEKKSTYIAFDMDGTIYDSAEIVVDAFREGIISASEKISRMDMAVPSHEEILRLVGLPAYEIYSRIFPQLSRRELDVVNNECNDSFVRIISAGGGALIDGAREVLEGFRHEGYKLLMASNGRREYIEAILNAHDIYSLFSGPLYFIGDDIPDKTDILALYLERLAGGDILIMVGDRESDRLAAIRNGVPFIGCAFGHVGDEEIRGERWIVQSFGEIPAAVKEIEREHYGL